MPMQVKPYTYWSLLLLSLLLVLVACGKERDELPDAGMQPFQTEYLGGSDQALVQAKGTGIENIAVIDGKEVILSRVYQEKFLGYDSELTVMLSSSGMIEYALYSLTGEKEAVAAALSQALGKSTPDEVSASVPGLGYKAIWHKGPYLYTMIGDGSQVTIAIIKE